MGGLLNTEEELRERIKSITLQIEKRSGEYSKTELRDIHAPSVLLELKKAQPWITKKIDKYIDFFANGDDIDPNNIEPVLIEVEENWQKDLFRLARFTWSLPYSKGFGRRLRFLVIDSSNNKLIGILGLQSPPLDFPARDKLFNYPSGRKVEIVNQMMDIFTLGALPPYNTLLAGKLIAFAAISNEIRVAYEMKYSSRVTEIDKRVLPAGLIALTTTSAFGRSSIYNRLKFRDKLVAQSIGYTQGYGSFHLTEVYPLVCKYLNEKGISTKGGFGVGPRIVWQTFIRAQKQLGLPEDILKHGIKREAFLFELIHDLKGYINGTTPDPKYYEQSFIELAYFWKDRWLKRRALTSNGWHSWKNAEIRDLLIRPKE